MDRRGGHSVRIQCLDFRKNTWYLFFCVLIQILMNDKLFSFHSLPSVFVLPLPDHDDGVHLQHNRHRGGEVPQHQGPTGACKTISCEVRIFNSIVCKIDASHHAMQHYSTHSVVQKNSCMFEFSAFLPPTNLGLPMHISSALTEHLSVNLARFFCSTL